MTYRKTTEAIARLTPEQCRVTQRAAPKSPVTGALQTTRSLASTST